MATFTGTLFSLAAVAGAAALVVPALTRAVHGKIADMQAQATRVERQIAVWFKEWQLPADADLGGALSADPPASSPGNGNPPTAAVPAPSEPISPARWFLGDPSWDWPYRPLPPVGWRSWRRPDGFGRRR